MLWYNLLFVVGFIFVNDFREVPVTDNRKQWSGSAGVKRWLPRFQVSQRQGVHCHQSVFLALKK